jgi:glutamyl-tRNA reductase
MKKDKIMTINSKPSLQEVIDEIMLEVCRAESLHEPMNSAHEGYAVIKEEFDELWEHVMMKQKNRNIEEMRKEAIEVAAMSVRFIRDICDGGRGRR